MATSRGPGEAGATKGVTSKRAGALGAWALAGALCLAVGATEPVARGATQESGTQARDGGLERAKELLDGVQASLGRGGGEDAREQLEQAIGVLRGSRGNSSGQLLARAWRQAGGLALELGQAEQARAALEIALELLEGAEDGDELELATTRLLQGQALGRLEDYEAATAQVEAAVGVFDRLLDEDHPTRVQARYRMGLVLALAGRLGRSREFLEGVVEVRSRRLGLEDPDRIDAHIQLGSVHFDLGDYRRAAEQISLGVDGLARTRPAHDPYLLDFRRVLAICLRVSGDHGGALEQRRERAQALSAVRAPDDTALLLARQDAAQSLSDLGRLVEARAEFEEILKLHWARSGGASPEWLDAIVTSSLCLAEHWRHAEVQALLSPAVEVIEGTELASGEGAIQVLLLLAEAHEFLGEVQRAAQVLARALERAEAPGVDLEWRLIASGRLCVLLIQLGDLVGALPRIDATLAVAREARQADHVDLLRLRAMRALALAHLGERARSRQELESLLEDLARTNPRGSEAAGATRTMLAMSLRDFGESARAEALLAEGLQDLERLLPRQHSTLQAALALKAILESDRGDRSFARARLEELLRVYEQTLSADHALIQGTRLHLATTLLHQEEPEAARALLQSILESQAAALDVALASQARRLLAGVLGYLGDTGRAVALLEDLLREEQARWPDHANVALGRLALATMLRVHGEPGRALLLLEGLSADERDPSLGLFEPKSLLHLRLLCLHEAGEFGAAQALLPSFLDALLERCRSASRRSQREAQEILASDAAALDSAIHLARDAGPEIRRQLFELVETRRGVGAASARVAALAEDDPLLAAHVAEADRARTTLGALMAEIRDSRLPEDELRGRLAQAVEARDRAESSLTGALAEHGLQHTGVSAAELAARLPDGAAAVGFLRHRWPEAVDGGRPLRTGREHLLAHVLHAGGDPVRVELGPIDELAALAHAWRAAIGGGAAARGLGLSAPGATEEFERTGLALRRRLVDPLLAVLPAAPSALWVAADDLVHLVPLDALPLDGGGVLGDRLAVLVQPSLAQLSPPADAALDEPSMLVLGGIDYGMQRRTRAERAAAADTGERAAPEGFESLPGAADEARALARLFEQRFGRPAVHLERRRATKAALIEAAPGKTIVHLATHGWFAPLHPATLRPELPVDAPWSPLGLGETVASSAPLTLCGLALAGANRGRDGSGALAGILTGQELVSLDLSACRLAVLSACETQVGLERPGQGLHSLQSALHAAGARTTVASLWKVDDAATSELMQALYRGLLHEELSPAEALRRAKVELRGAARPPADWAAWVLSGAGD